MRRVSASAPGKSSISGTDCRQGEAEDDDISEQAMLARLELNARETLISRVLRSRIPEARRLAKDERKVWDLRLSQL